MLKKTTLIDVIARSKNLINIKSFNLCSKSENCLIFFSFNLSQATFPIQVKNTLGASLVAQWLRICLPMQGTRVRALVWEDPTCRGAARPVSHNY